MYDGAWNWLKNASKTQWHLSNGLKQILVNFSDDQAKLVK